MVNWDCDLTRSPIIHIGYPKCASSTLQNSLFTNWSEVCFAGGRSEDKGNDLANQAFDFVIDVMEKDSLEFRPGELRERYGRMFGGTPQPVLISNEALAFGSYFGGRVDRLQVADRINKLVPDAEIVIVIRNQLTMIPSLFGEVLKSGGWIRQDFSSWLEDQWESRGYHGYLHLLKFNDLVECYIEKFGRESVHVIVLENLSNHTEKVVDTFRSLVGVKDGHQDEIKNLLSNKRNTRITEIERFFYPAYNFLSAFPWIRRLIHPLKEKVPRLGTNTDFTFSTAIEPNIPDGWKEKIADYYRRSNNHLVAMLDRPELADHGYPL